MSRDEVPVAHVASLISTIALITVPPCSPLISSFMFLVNVHVLLRSPLLPIAARTEVVVLVFSVEGFLYYGRAPFSFNFGDFMKLHLIKLYHLQL